MSTSPAGQRQGIDHPPAADPAVLPGDTISVRERFFRRHGGASSLGCSGGPGPARRLEEEAGFASCHCFRSPVGGIFRHVRDLSMRGQPPATQVGIVCDASTGGAREDELFAEILPYLGLGLQRIDAAPDPPTDIVTLTKLFAASAGSDPTVIHAHRRQGGVGRVSTLCGSLVRAWPHLLPAWRQPAL